MSNEEQRRSFWHRVPLVGFALTEWQVWRAERTRPCYTLAPEMSNPEGLTPYPIDMWPLLSSPKGPLDEAGVLLYLSTSSELPSGYYPTSISQYALARWNAYLASGEEEHKQSFLVQARWLAEHATALSDELSGWPFTVSLPHFHARTPWLSALIQGNCISVLVRAYRLTSDEALLQLARRAVRTFELDISEGGVSTTVGVDGIFFEEVAAYPAAHILNGYLFSLFGLYDYVELTGDAGIAALIEQSQKTLHRLIDGYDAGYWSRYDLLHRDPAPWFYHDQHAVLLLALARYSDCAHCRLLAARWTRYQRSLVCRLRYVVVSRGIRYRRAMQRIGLRGTFARIFVKGTGSVQIPVVAHAGDEVSR